MSNSDTHTTPPQPQLQVPDKFAYLQALTSSSRHGKKSFYQHLLNVHNYLQSQSLSPEVCDAGLFHSIYGTEFYQFEDATITRDAVRGYISEYAEELVHMYCGLRKGRFKAIADNTMGWSTRQHLDLCWLENANCWDVKENRDVEEQLNTLGHTIRRFEEEISSGN